MQNQSSFNNSSTTGISEHLAPDNDFSSSPQVDDISSQFFLNTSTTINPNISSMEDAGSENIWDNSISTVDNVTSLSLMEQPDYSFVDNSDSVESFVNQSNELSKHYSNDSSHGVPSIMEDSISERYKPKRKRRNSLPLNRGMKRKLSTGSDITSTYNINDNSSNSSCDLASAVECSTTPAWISCYSPYRKRTPSVASSEKANSLISKLFTEEEKQRFLAAKKKSQITESKKRLKCVNLLDSAQKYCLDDVACTSSLNSSIFSDEAILSKSESPLPIPENQNHLFGKEASLIIKPPIESEINVSCDIPLHLIENPVTNKNVNLFSDLSTNSSLEALNDPDQQNIVPLPRTNVINKSSEAEVVSFPLTLNSDASIEVSATNINFEIETPLIDTKFESVEVNRKNLISNDNFSNVEITDSLENIFIASQVSDNKEDKQTDKVPFIFNAENLLPSVQPLVSILSPKYKETNVTLSEVNPTDSKEANNSLPNISTENSESIQPECSVDNGESINYSMFETVLSSVNYEDNNGSTVYLDENGSILNVININCESELKEATYASVPSIEKHDIQLTFENQETTLDIPTSDSSNCKNNHLSDDPKIVPIPESISKNQNTQNIMKASTVEFDYLVMNKSMMKNQSVSLNHITPEFEASNISIDYLELQKSLMESHGEMSNITIPVTDQEISKKDLFLLESDKIIGSNNNDYCASSEIITMRGANNFYKATALDLETVQEVPNILELEKPLGKDCFVNNTMQLENQTLNISMANFESCADKPFTEVLNLDSSLCPEASFIPIESIDLLPDSIPISNGEADMLAYFANLSSKKASKARKSSKSKITNFNSSVVESSMKFENSGTSFSSDVPLQSNTTIDSENYSNDVEMGCITADPEKCISPEPSHLIASETARTTNQTPQKSSLQNGTCLVAKKTFACSRHVSSESSNSIRRSSSDSNYRHNRTDSSSSADEFDDKPYKQKHGSVDVNNASTTDNLAPSTSSIQRKTALKTFKKPFTVAKKSVDEKTAFKSVIQSYFGVRTALKTCSNSSNHKSKHKKSGGKDSVVIISLQNKSDVELSPEELSSDEAKASVGSWSPMKDLPLLKSTCQCSAEEVPCLCSGETLQLICEAEDSIDGKIIPCMKNVFQQYLLTPSTKLKHKAYCNIHLTRLRKHHCCPVCGLFCSQGTFLHCSQEHTLKFGKENHLFHPTCFIIPAMGLPPSCPHCCKFSDFNEVQLHLFDTSEQQDTSQNPSLIPEGENITSDIENYHILMTAVNKQENVTKEGKAEEALQKDELYTMLMAITKERSLSLRPTGKCLFNPIKNGDVRKVMQLIVNGVDPNHKFVTHKHNTPLHIAAFYGFVGIVRLLLQYGALIDAVNDDLETPLILAVGKKQMPVVRCLLLAGAQIDAKNENGLTAFHLATKNNYIEIAKLLYNTGRFSVNIQDANGWTPLVWACELNNLNLVQWLLELGADPNIQDNEGNTALHWAAWSGDCEIIEMLLEKSCNLTFVNERGDSALHVAARKDHHACVRLLLSKGASLDCKNKDSETPLMCCEKGFKSLKIFKMRSSISTDVDKNSQQHVVYRDISRGSEFYPIQAVNEVDQQEFIMEFRYITKNCHDPNIGVKTTIDSMSKCFCKDNCNSGSCLCTKISKCWYDVDERLTADFDMCDPPAVYECSKICRCPMTCINRVVQKGLRIPLQIFRTYDRGWGVRTLKSIPKGTFICEYIGEIVTGVDVVEREDDSYLFDLESKNGDFCIDGRFYGNVARFINHSCDPNLVSIRVFVEHQDKNFPRIAFFAMRSIDALEELSFDYGIEFWIAKSHTFLCTCKSSFCKYSKDSIDDTLQAYASLKEAELLNM